MYSCMPHYIVRLDTCISDTVCTVQSICSFSSALLNPVRNTVLMSYASATCMSPNSWYTYMYTYIYYCYYFVTVFTMIWSGGLWCHCYRETDAIQRSLEFSNVRTCFFKLGGSICMEMCNVCYKQSSRLSLYKSTVVHVH